MLPGHTRATTWRVALTAAAAVAMLAACTSNTTGTATTHSGSVTPPSSSVPSISETPTVSTPPESLTPSTSTTPAISSPPVLPQTSLVITRYGWDAAAHKASAVAILPGKVINTGSCTLTITLAGVSRTATKASTPDASSTDCGLITITDTTLSPGTWSGSVSFTGGGTTATSTTFPITVTA